jgi:crotonobetainyl-CoA:carnitine CoA-transferase CaiB-like acyl-CoA transferase
VLERTDIHQEMGEATQKFKTAALMKQLANVKIPHAPINTVRQVRAMDAISSRLTVTRTPDGRHVRLPPMAVDMDDGVVEYPFPPRYNQDTRKIMGEAGLSETEMDGLQEAGIIPE